MGLLEKCLEEEGIKYRRIDGSLTLKEREFYLSEFQKDPEVTVIILSLKVGATGLNLMAANNVFIVDPWWNPAIENQAIERVYRIGQTKDVNVVRFICKKTIEEQILELNEKKKGLVDFMLKCNIKEQQKINMENILKLMRGFEDYM